MLAARRITISLETRDDRRIPVESFKAALENISVILHEVELELSEIRRARLSWNIAELRAVSRMWWKKESACPTL
mgnify:CR=1 FL=1